VHVKTGSSPSANAPNIDAESRLDCADIDTNSGNLNTMPVESTTTKQSRARGLLGLPDLPSELRVLIFELAFPPTQVDVIFGNTLILMGLRFLLHDGEPSSASLLTTCKQLYLEASAALWDNTSFGMRIDGNRYSPERSYGKLDGDSFCSNVCHLAVTIISPEPYYAECYNERVDCLVGRINGMKQLKSLRLETDMSEGTQDTWDGLLRALSFIDAKAKVEVLRMAASSDAEQRDLMGFYAMLEKIGGYVPSSATMACQANRQ